MRAKDVRKRCGQRMRVKDVSGGWAQRMRAKDACADPRRGSHPHAGCVPGGQLPGVRVEVGGQCLKRLLKLVSLQGFVSFHHGDLETRAGGGGREQWAFSILGWAGMGMAQGRGWGRARGAGRELRSGEGSRRKPPALPAPTRGRPRPWLHAPGSSGRQWPLRAPGSRPPCPPVAGERPLKPAELGSWRRREVGARGAMTLVGGGSPGESPGRGHGASTT